MNLFMISLGGKARNTNIEVHDIKFVIAEKLEDTFSILKKDWYGLIENLHIDSYAKIDAIDNFDIELTKKPNNKIKLFFIYFGGYDSNDFNEIHKMILLGASDVDIAKELAYEKLELSKEQWHLDEINNVQDKVLISDNNNYYIKLMPSTEKHILKPDWYGYKRLDK